MPIEQFETPTQSVFCPYLFLMKLLLCHVMVQRYLEDSALQQLLLWCSSLHTMFHFRS